MSSTQGAASLLTAAYIKVLGDTLSMPVFMMPQRVIVKPLREMLDEVVIDLPQNTGRLFCAQTSFSTAINTKGKSTITEADGRIIMWPDKASFRALTEALGV